MAAKSILSRLLTAGNLASRMRRLMTRRSRSSSSSSTRRSRYRRRGGLARQLLVLAQDGRQLQLHQVMDEQHGGHGGRRAGRGRIGLGRHAAYGSQRSAGTLKAVGEPGALFNPAFIV